MTHSTGDVLVSEHAFVLLQEVHHRVANQLQSLLGLLSLSPVRQASGGVGDAHPAVERVRHIAQLNRRIYEAPSAPSFSRHCHELCLGVLSAFGRPDIELQIEFEAEPASDAHKLTIALICTELVTNALKHSLVDGRSGFVRLKLTAEPCGTLRLISSDSARVDPSTALRVSEIVRLLAESAGGSVAVSLAHGYIATVMLP
jgi:two-component sensor histidine kinase